MAGMKNMKQQNKRNINMTREDILARLWNNTHVVDPIDIEESCWLWTGSTNRDGYGLTTVIAMPNGRRNNVWGVHVLSYTLYKDPVPKGAFVCHSCDNPPCWNPRHLFLGDHAINNADTRRKGRNWRLVNVPPGGVVIALGLFREEE